MKELGGGGALCILKAFSYILLPLDLKASDKRHETECTQKLHHVFVLQDVFCGLKSSQE